jgi:PmbA protein
VTAPATGTAVHSLLERLASKTQESEVYERSSDTIEVSFTNGAVKGALARESSGVALRAIKDGKLGFASSTDRTARAEGRLVDNLLNSIAVGDKVGFSFPKRLAATAHDLGSYDEKTAKLTPQDLVRMGERAIATIKEKHPDIALDVDVTRSIVAVRLANSHGARFEDRGTSISVGIGFNRTRESDVLLDGDGYSAVARNEKELDEAIARVIEKLDRAKIDVKLAYSGMLPVFFTSSGASVVWSPIFQGLSGKAVQTGTSPIREKRGQPILDPRIEITDDGLCPNMLGSAPYDDEGVPRRTRALVKDGVLEGFVHDLKTAAATKQEPTGNGERPGVLGQPGPSFTNVMIRPGPKSERELLRSIDYGLLVESVIGMGQGNTISGAFSNTVNLAFVVEKGEVTGRVKDISIAGNAYEVLKDRLGGLGAELDTSSGSSRRPALLVSALSVVGK